MGCEMRFNILFCLHNKNLLIDEQYKMYFRRYSIGTKVLLRLHDPELSELFLGSTKELTLLEADATLLGLYHPNSAESMEAALRQNIEKEGIIICNLSLI